VKEYILLKLYTYAAKGAIFRAKALEMQYPAPPVANQNSEVFYNKS